MNPAPVLALQAKVLFAPPNVPQSSHDRFTPSAAATDAVSSSAAAAIQMHFFMISSRQRCKGDATYSSNVLTVEALDLAPARIASRSRRRATRNRRSLPRRVIRQQRRL